MKEARVLKVKDWIISKKLLPTALYITNINDSKGRVLSSMYDFSIKGKITNHHP